MFNLYITVMPCNLVDECSYVTGNLLTQS